MTIKRVIAIVLILVFSIPLIPVSQVGFLLSTNQMTEEIVHESVAHPIQADSSDLIHDFVASSQVVVNDHKISTDEDFTTRQADDVQTPPPNVKG
jgi:hypothetical protein